MKKYQIINYHHLLSKVDLQKVNKEARAKLINLDLTLGDIVDEHNAEIEKVKARLSKGHEEVIRKVSALIAELQTVADEGKKIEIQKQLESHTDYAVIQNQLDEEVNKRLVEEVTVEVEKVASADLADWCAASGVRITLDILREFRKAGFIS